MAPNYKAPTKRYENKTELEIAATLPPTIRELLNPHNARILPFLIAIAKKDDARAELKKRTFFFVGDWDLVDVVVGYYFRAHVFDDIVGRYK